MLTWLPLNSFSLFSLNTFFQLTLAPSIYIYTARIGTMASVGCQLYSYYSFHHNNSTRLSLIKNLFHVLLLIVILIPNILTFDEAFYHQIPFNNIISSSENSAVYTSEEYTQSCYIKINYAERCSDYGPSCNFKFEWSYPEHLLELINEGFNPRIRIIDDLPYNLPFSQDTVVYASHLLIANIGYSHRGIWACNFKFINNETNKMDAIQKSFEIRIIEDGKRGEACILNDQCSSFVCRDEKCICNAEQPIEINNSCSKAPNIGEECNIDSDCQQKVEDSSCFCSTFNEKEKCSGSKTCQCAPNYVAVSFGLGKYRCLKKAKINEHCTRSQQCESVDVNTYCTFSGKCECRRDQTCRSPAIRTCRSKSDCEFYEYCGNGRCQTVKDLYESCGNSDECDEKQICSTNLAKCVCQPGYKASPIKMVCIPEDYCLSDIDCDGGYCTDNTCEPGVSLHGRCVSNQQCQALDKNSFCSDDEYCVCGPIHYENSQGICLMQGHCRVNDDCSNEPFGQCYLEECIYMKNLGERCSNSKQCIFKTSYSHCLASTSKCSCLNGNPIENKSCPSERACNDNDDCLMNSVCDKKQNICLCKDGYKLANDGICYKKALPIHITPESFWQDLWNQYSLYLIIGASVLGFLISLLCCCIYRCCCKYEQVEQATTREGHQRPASGRFIPNRTSDLQTTSTLPAPTAPPAFSQERPSYDPPPYSPPASSYRQQPSNISGKF